MKFLRNLFTYSTDAQADNMKRRWFGLLGLLGIIFSIIAASLVGIGILGWAYVFMLSPFA